MTLRQAAEAARASLTDALALDQTRPVMDAYDVLLAWLHSPVPPPAWFAKPNGPA
jgi:hypothetical protein